MKDVAAMAGVSVGTVSNVLNNPTRVGDATRRRVEHAIGVLGFVRNESARQLRAGRSRVMAFVAIDAANPFFVDVAGGIEEVAQGSGLALFLCNSAQDRTREREYLSLLLEQRVRGILVTPVDDLSALVGWRTRGTPIVLVDCDAPVGDWCSVSVDDVEGGFLAVSHLLEGGHRQIAFVGGPMTTVQVRDRFAGARKAVQLAGRDADALTVLDVAALDAEQGRRAGERLAGLPVERRPTAAFCANDLVALGLLQEMTRRGVAVPRGMAIVGYDDIEFASSAAVALTSVRQPRHLLGRTAAILLLEESVGVEHEHQRVRFTPELIVRDSSGGLATAAPSR